MSPVSLAYFVALFRKSYGNSSVGDKLFLVRFQFSVSSFGHTFSPLSFSVDFVFLMVLCTLHIVALQPEVYFIFA